MTTREYALTSRHERDTDESKTSVTDLILEISEAIGPSIWTTADVTQESLPDIFIKMLFTMLSWNPIEVSRLVVMHPERLVVLKEIGDISDRIHVGIDLDYGDEPSRIDALRAVAVSAKFIKCHQVESDLTGIDLSGIDYVIDDGCRYRVENGVIQ